MKYIILLILLMPTVVAYNRYYLGNVNLTMVYNAINSIPQEYFSNLDSMYLFEGNCCVKKHTIERNYATTFLSDEYDGWYYYDYLDFGNYIYITTAEIYLCNLGIKNTMEIRFNLLHEIGHHFQISQLGHRTLNESFAENFDVIK